MLAPSWWFGAALVVLLYLPAIVELLPGVRALTALALGVAFAVLLGVSVLAHELGHCVLARRLGLPVRRVRLFLLGGVTEISAPSRSPRDEGLVAVAGPLVSVVLAVVGAVGWSLTTPGTSVWLVAAQFTVANALVAAFNMLPGLPLDGGRVLRAVVWAVSGRRETGTLVGIIGAVVVALALVVWALWGYPADGGWTRIAVASAMVVFLVLGARAELLVERAQRVPAGLTLAGLVRPVLELPAEIPLVDALTVAAGRGVVLVSGAGTAVGLLDEDLAEEVVGRDPRASARSAAEHIRPEAVFVITEPLSEIIARVREVPAWRFLIVDLDGAPAGVLRREDLRDALAS